jgi:hypothetical protein
MTTPAELFAIIRRWPRLALKYPARIVVCVANGVQIVEDDTRFPDARAQLFNVHFEQPV